MIENILLVLLILLLGAKIIGSLFERFGIDSSLGELLTGLILGPSLLNMVEAKSIEYFAIIGSVLILFVVGIKQEDIDEISHDHKAVFLGLTLLLVTSIIMTLFFYFVPPYFGVTFTWLQAIVLAFAFAIIDVGVPAKIMITQKLITLPVGKIVVRSSIVDIILGLLMFTIASTLVNLQWTDALWKLGGIVLFTIITLLVFYFFSQITSFVLKLHVHEAEFSIALILVLAMAYMTEILGFSSILGAFIAGVFISRVSFAESRSFSDKIHAISFGLFVPLFFVWFGLEINLAEILKNILLAGIIFLLYTSIRFLITYFYLKKNNLSAPLTVSASMLSVDVESLVVLMVATTIGIFPDKTPLNLFAPSVLLSTLFIVILVAIFSKKELKKMDTENI